MPGFICARTAPESSALNGELVRALSQVDRRDLLPTAAHCASLVRLRRTLILSSMELTEEVVNEFAAIWKEEFGESLSPSDARHEASLLMELCSLLARPLPGAPSQSANNPPK